MIISITNFHCSLEASHVELFFYVTFIVINIMAEIPEVLAI